MLIPISLNFRISSCIALGCTPTTIDMLVRDALHASMGIPGVIHPLLYHGRYLADGSFGRTHPARVIRDYTALLGTTARAEPARP
jgi:predicted acylesterase/phospholipase RssA